MRALHRPHASDHAVERRNRSRALVAWLVLTLSAALGLAFVVFGRELLPERFLGDGRLIQLIAQEQVSHVHDSSYRSVAAIYAALDLAHSPMIAGLLGYAAMVSVTLFALRGRLPALRHLHILLVTVACFALGAVFLGWYSKDFLVLPLSAAVAAQMQRTHPHRQWAWTLLPLLTYAVLLRPYWVGIAAIFAGYFTATRFRPARTPGGFLAQLLLLSQAVLLATAILMPIVLGEPADFARESANRYRLGSGDAESAIIRYVDTLEPLSTYVNVALVSTALVLPWPLLLTGNAVHLIYAVFISAVWLGLGVRVLRSRKYLASREWEAVRVGMCFLAAILTVQALFEPDFGSYLRHLTPVFPIALCVLAVLNSPVEPRAPEVVSTADAAKSVG